jgi:hypothetical protein
VGDTVFCKIDEVQTFPNGDRVEPGLRGRVVKPSHQGGDGSTWVLVDFEGNYDNVAAMPDALSRKAPLSSRPRAAAESLHTIAIRDGLAVLSPTRRAFVYSICPQRSSICLPPSRLTISHNGATALCRRLLSAPIFWTELSRPLSNPPSSFADKESAYLKVFQLCIELAVVCDWRAQITAEGLHEKCKNLHEVIGNEVRAVLQALDGRSFDFMQARPSSSHMQ